MKEIAERLSRLRELMRREHLSAFIFPSTDPHNSEYVPQHWEGRKWMSGFTGSAGTAVVTLTSAAVWTDSRYFLAAADELSDTEYQLMKERMPGTPTIAQWLGNELADAPTTEVGVDGSCLSAEEVETLVTELRENGGLTLRTNIAPLAEIWTSRPPIPARCLCISRAMLACRPMTNFRPCVANCLFVMPMACWFAPLMILPGC